MSEDETDAEKVNKPKRPAVNPQLYSEIRALADKNVAFSADGVGWDKCLEVVIDEYIDGSERERTAWTKGWLDE